MIRADEAPFKESEHPREKGGEHAGQFMSGGGGGGSSGKSEGGNGAAAPVKTAKKSIGAKIKSHAETIKKHGAATAKYFKGKSAGEVISAIAKDHRTKDALSFALQSIVSHGTGVLHHATGGAVPNIQGLDPSTWNLNEHLFDHTVSHFADIAAITKLQAKDLMRRTVKGLLAQRAAMKAGPKVPIPDDDDEDGIDEVLKALLDLLEEDDENAPDRADDSSITAAGILLVTKDGQALFLKRGEGGDHAGEWDLPGGRVEPGEAIEQAVSRETIEETGRLPEGDRTVFARRIDKATGVDFTTFLQRIEAPYIPTLNDEHTGYAWAPVIDPPQPLHPGVKIVIDKLSMDELGIARAIAAGDLTSPQQYANVWLFALRITGTGTAYRSKINEYVYRQPENYLTDEFLTRCNGLPVIFKHPETAILNSKEFTDRIVGTVVLPYIDGDEVWGVAKIYDAEAVTTMQERQLSTSPSVVLLSGVNHESGLQDGSKLLVEGKISLLDHLAICENGVWDKGDGPSGVKSEIRGDSSMPTPEEVKAKADAEAAEAKKKADAEAEEKAKAEKAKADAEAAEEQKLDKVLVGLDALGKMCDGMSKRMDSFEDRFKKPDGEGETEEERKARADAKAKKDSEEAEEKKKTEEKAKADAAAKADAEMKDRLAAVESLLPKSLADADYGAMAEAQAKADSAYSMFGLSAPRPMHGESLAGYRVRLLKPMQAHSQAFKGVALEKAAAADSSILDGIEPKIYADACEVARSPATVPLGELRQVSKVMPSGHRINEYVGQPSAWMNSIAGPTRQYATKFLTPTAR